MLFKRLDTMMSAASERPARMERSTATLLRIGDWCVNAASGEISKAGETVRLEARAMRLLLCLAEHRGEVVSIDDLLNQVWSGVSVTQDSVYQAVASLRRQLGDDAKQPAYIATVPRLGYRMVAEVRPWQDQPISPPNRSRFRRGLALAAGVVLSIGAGAFLFRDKAPSVNLSASTAIAAQQPTKSIAVLPFLDLTEGMKNETFADGMTEELIDRLSKIPGLRVPPPTSSFYYKEKQIPVAEIAKGLGVSYILDGSLRKSGGRVRIAARLIRAESGYIVWSESYDRSFDDILMVQDDIAGKVIKALRASIEAPSDHR